LAFCQAGEWKEYVYAEDGFAISSPVEPRMEKRTMKPIGGEVEAHFYYFPAPGLIMAVMLCPAASERQAGTGRSAQGC
jgi:hypothetical protein